MPVNGVRRRHSLLKRDGPACFYCSRILRKRVFRQYAPVARGRDWTIDHIIPSCEGGTDAIANQVLACADCNSERGVTPADEFLRRRFLACAV